MVFSCSRFADSGMLDLVVALAVIGFILVFGIVSRWLFPCPVCNDAFESSPNEDEPVSRGPEGFWGIRHNFNHPRKPARGGDSGVG